MLRKSWRQCVQQPGNIDAWDEFLGRVQPLFERVARRIAFSRGIYSPVEIDDFVQDICLKVTQMDPESIELIPDDDEIVESYLCKMAANAARDSLRAQFAGKRGKQATVSLEYCLDVLAGSLDSCGVDQDILFGQVDNLLQDWSARERAIFWLYYQQGLTAREIGAIPALHLTAKGVESLLLRMVTRVRVRIGSTKDGGTNSNHLKPPSTGGH